MTWRLIKKQFDLCQLGSWVDLKLQLFTGTSFSSMDSNGKPCSGQFESCHPEHLSAMPRKRRSLTTRRLDDPLLRVLPT